MSTEHTINLIEYSPPLFPSLIVFSQVHCKQRRPLRRGQSLKIGLAKRL